MLTRLFYNNQISGLVHVGAFFHVVNSLVSTLAYGFIAAYQIFITKDK